MPEKFPLDPSTLSPFMEMCPEYKDCRELAVKLKDAAQSVMNYNRVLVNRLDALQQLYKRASEKWAVGEVYLKEDPFDSVTQAVSRAVGGEVNTLGDDSVACIVRKRDEQYRKMARVIQGLISSVFAADTDTEDDSGADE